MLILTERKHKPDKPAPEVVAEKALNVRLEEDNEDKGFCNFLYHSMRKLPQAEKIDLQLQIHQTLAEYLKQTTL